MHVTIPLVSTNASDVTIVRWLAAPGDLVAQGEVLLEVTTDKAAFEISAPGSGVLRRVYAAPRSVVPIGMIVGVIGGPEEPDEQAVAQHNEAVLARYRETLGLPQESSATGPQSATPAGTTSPNVPVQARAPAAAAIRATPKARRIATERQIDLEAVQAATGATIVTEAVLQAYLQGDSLRP